MSRARRSPAEDPTGFEIETGPSRSQKKRDAEALQALGEELVGLKPATLRQLPMSERLLEALLHAQSISAHGGRRRQLQFIGKLMREEDAQALRDALYRMDPSSAHAVRLQHLCETWRARLLDEGEPALAELAAAAPMLDVDRTRTLVEQARHEMAGGYPPKSSRELFRFLRAALDVVA
ncbi:MAG: ribosome biogenesis factor YjgA [Halothiobacillaceae bacterium]|jgi:ribosome-associated protein|nr:ribosome biogenesis factor YjgA [Halothiobacillaceae bacterium]MDY0049237.1 ribosome biogenesis factor YjgA [Halothiobacillaceae bacterium]